MNSYVKMLLTMVIASSIAALTAIVLYAIHPEWPIAMVVEILAPVSFIIIFFLWPEKQSQSNE